MDLLSRHLSAAPSARRSSLFVLLTSVSLHWIEVLTLAAKRGQATPASPLLAIPQPKLPINYGAPEKRANNSMNPGELAVVVSIGLFLGMLACLELGYRIGLYVSEKTELSHEGTGAIEAAVFALLGLLLGFTFANGISRLDQRRELIVREANAIGTAYLRLDLLPTSQQPEMRRLFREYLDARLSVYEKLPDLNAAERELTHAAQLQQEIWSKAVSAGLDDSSQNVARLLLPTLNDMIDVTTSRTIAWHTHLPPLIFGLSISVALLSGLLAGYDMAKRKGRSGLHVLLYALVISLTIYTVLDLDYPRFGLIRLNAADSALFSLRDSIR